MVLEHRLVPFCEILKWKNLKKRASVLKELLWHRSYSLRRLVLYRPSDDPAGTFMKWFSGSSLECQFDFVYFPMCGHDCHE